MRKQTTSQILLSEEDLAKSFDKVRVDIKDELHPVVEHFITAASGWNGDAEALSECEWEEIRPLFDGLRRVTLNLGEATIAFYDERISGDLALRAAKRGKCAYELMGVVLSRFLIRYEFTGDRYFGWYFLNDYAEWLGQREEQIADLMIVSPEETARGELLLSIVCSEAKYIDEANLSKKRKESQKQLRDTVRRIHEALFGNPDRLDRELWLARLADLVLDGVEFAAGQSPDVGNWRHAIRDGRCKIMLRGYSHVFVHSPDFNNSDAFEIADVVKQFAEARRVSEEDSQWLKQIVKQMKTGLQQFNLQAKLLSETMTPNAALLKFAGSSNLTVEQVIKRRSEFLTTYGLNIISIQPEPNVVSIAVERSEREVVNLATIWQLWSPARTEGNQAIAIAVRENDGSILYLNPNQKHASHTLIAGSTGSGKSVLMQNILLGIAATNTPSQARIILIDPKQGVDYFQFEDLPHLGDGVIVDDQQAIARLQSLVVEMDARYSRFKQARANNITSYNQKVDAADRMATVWLIHDEFAEWMMVDEYKEAVSTTVQRLGVKARAAGIHLIFAAQRPDANVMPMQLRANLGNRLILRVDGEGTSEIALGDKGAEKLLGKGHLLAKLEGETGLVYAQVPLASEAFADEIIRQVIIARKMSDKD